MKFGIVSDIHGNADGLAEALRAMGDVDELFCCGDTVSHTRFSNEVVGMLRERGARMVLGNHDVDYLKRLADAQAASGKADGALVDWLRAQPERVELEVAGRRLLMVHATPWTYEYVFPGSPQMKRYAEVEADYVLGGHTHCLFAGRFGRALVINPGSAGHGRQTDGGMALSCAVLDPVSGEADLIDFPDQPAGFR